MVVEPPPAEFGFPAMTHVAAKLFGLLSAAGFAAVFAPDTVLGPDKPATGPVVTSRNTTVMVRMTEDLAFEPSRLTLTAGDTVEWVVAGTMPHATTDRPGAAALAEHTVLPPGAAVWDSGLLESGGRFRQVLTTPGEYTYVCLLHEAGAMIGHITVR